MRDKGTRSPKREKKKKKKKEWNRERRPNSRELFRVPAGMRNK